jgi:hypothetical protein
VKYQFAKSLSCWKLFPSVSSEVLNIANDLVCLMKLSDMSGSVDTEERNERGG